MRDDSAGLRVARANIRTVFQWRSEQGRKAATPPSSDSDVIGPNFLLYNFWDSDDKDEFQTWFHIVELRA